MFTEYFEFCLKAANSSLQVDFLKSVENHDFLEGLKNMFHCVLYHAKNGENRVKNMEHNQHLVNDTN